MHVLVDRLDQRNGSTLGLLFIDQEFVCFTLEDGESPDPYGRKVPGRTRIPAGTYDLKLRHEGGRVVQEYQKRYGPDHAMLWLQDVPGFSFIYIHAGNTPKDTEGCLLVGFRGVVGASGDPHQVQESRRAYELVHGLLAKAIQSGQSLTVEVRDEWPQNRRP